MVGLGFDGVRFFVFRYDGWCIDIEGTLVGVVKLTRLDCVVAKRGIFIRDV